MSQEASTAETREPRWWVVRGTISSRVERQNMDYAEGRALWAPQRDRGGKDIYHHTRKVQTGDVCLHLTGPGAISGISRVAGPPRVDFDPRREGGLDLDDIGVHEGLWYLVRLKDYRLLDPPLAWSDIFTEGLRERLLSIRSATRSSGDYLFFTENLNPIGYVTPAPPALIDVLDEAYRKVSGKTLREVVLPPTRWDTFIEWAKRFYEWEHFDEQERDYKLAIGAKLKGAKDALLQGKPDWGDRLKKAIQDPDNNLLYHNGHPFLNLLDSNLDGLEDVLRRLWETDAGIPPQERVRRFIESIDEIDPAVHRKQDASLASCLLMADDAKELPIYRARPFNSAYEMTAYSTPKHGVAKWRRYGHALGFIDEFIARAEARGLRIQDRLDAQSLIWCVTTTELDHLPTVEMVAALALYRKNHVTPPPPPGGGPKRPLPGPSDPWTADKIKHLAEELLWEDDYLQKIIDGLRDKRQVIFQGPPGTGKTYVAKRIAEWCKKHGGDYRIVQFHPSYAYEDFVEGFRPTLTEDGQAGFKLTSGALRRIAKKAEANQKATFILVIDEINRGNLAKVLGELYFLLEYRDEKVMLQYNDGSNDERLFSLPKNLWFIGTMNTTDRSVGLLDAALRRRFYFFRFFPDEPPIKGLLHRWIDRNSPGAEWVAKLVDKANDKLEDRHLGIGPSYFMKKGTPLNEGRVRFIWEQAVIPYIEEQRFGDESRLEAFEFDRLRGELTPASVEPDAADAGAEDMAAEDEEQPEDPGE